jgi:DNA-binding protein YbaB
MFDNLKDIYNLRKQAQQMQSKLNEEKVMGSSKDGRFQVTLNGNQEIIAISVPQDGLEKSMVEAGVKAAFTDAQQKIKGILMQKMKELM